ncbi:MAG: glycosyltransferase [Nostoc sp.]|uniref:glycosyltransferase n=1 Tax=Nostoc sp. TaxID=1180 RepID=UPI002FF37929
MKINWFSPLSPAKSGIAEYTSRLIPALQKHAEIVLWTDQQHWSSYLEKYAIVRHYDLANIPWIEINQADLNVYHIGNNSDFHFAIWQVSCQCPGLVVLHDVKLQHFFASIYLHREQKSNVDAYLFQMKKYYGIQGEQAVVKFLRGNISTEYMAELYPLTFLALENAVGVVTHTKADFQTIKQQKRWFVGYAPLPYISQWQTNSQSKNNKAPYRLVIFGYLGANRGLDFLFNALSSLYEKNQFFLDIYGQVWNKSYIEQQIKLLGLNKLVKLHGFVSDAELDLALANANLAINLRYPTMGEASLSQLRIWSHALPSLVTQIGWYAEQSEDTVAFVRPNYEIEDIQQHLKSFLANPQYYTKIGENGQQLLQKQHNPEIYAQAIMSFGQKIQRFRRSGVAYKLIDKIGEELSNWMDYKTLDMQIKKVAEAIYFISN